MEHWEDDLCPEGDVAALVWLETAHATQWAGNVVLGPNEDFYFKGTPQYVFCMNAHACPRTNTCIVVTTRIGNMLSLRRISVK